VQVVCAIRHIEGTVHKLSRWTLFLVSTSLRVLKSGPCGGRKWVRPQCHHACGVVVNSSCRLHRHHDMTSIGAFDTRRAVYQGAFAITRFGLERVSTDGSPLPPLRTAFED
jgi:hypothetical protein